MDPFTIALAALNAGATGYNLYEQNSLNRAGTQFGRAQNAAEVRAAENQKAQYMDDLARRRRMLEESLASRGVEDSTIATDDTNYLNRGADRDIRGLNDRVDLARRGSALFNRQAASRRHGNYLNFGVGLANALGGAYSGLYGAGAQSVPMNVAF